MIIHQLTNHGTINEIQHSQVYITPQGMTHLPHPATDATDVAEVTDATEVTTPEETTEQRHARCLRTLFTLTTAKGTPLFTFSSQWTAVYRILVDYHGYPSEYRSFHLRMRHLQQALHPMEGGELHRAGSRVPSQLRGGRRAEKAARGVAFFPPDDGRLPPQTFPLSHRLSPLGNFVVGGFFCPYFCSVGSDVADTTNL